MERIYVTVRARPLSPEDAKSSPWRISGNSISFLNPPSKFEFDRIFREDCKTAEVYEARTKQIVAAAVQGFNGTVFAYGQTNSGKTHTMRGSASEPGVIPLAVRELFDIIQEVPNREFLLRMSYMEIYNEEINDLLAPEHRRLQIHESIERGIFVAGLSEEIVASPEQVLDLMEFGESHRHIGETNMNLHSSRSHTIFRMIIESRDKAGDEESDNSCDAVRVSVLNLVDLAGSERAAKTGAEGVRLKEGSHINKSLMTLGTVIKKLSEGAESQGGHVPYRDSKLTRILQPALGGNANTAIICNITLAQIHADETKSSLQFASRALRVTNCAHVNEILTDAALLKRQKKEIEELRAKLKASHSEHLEDEILSLRNTLLQTELERERIALELEEEKRAQVEREKRLKEQAKKIENLSSMVLYSNRDEIHKHSKKDKRRETWCPGKLTWETSREAIRYMWKKMEWRASKLLIIGAVMEILRCSALGVFGEQLFRELVETSHKLDLRTSGRKVRQLREPGPLVAFEDLVLESQTPIDISCKRKEDNSETISDDCMLPDPCTLLKVTSRRKAPQKKKSLPVENNELCELQAEYEDLLLRFETQRIMYDVQVECLKTKLTETYVKDDDNPTHCVDNASLRVENNLPSVDREAVLLIIQLQERIKELELEKSSSEQTLESVINLAKEHNTCAMEKSEELYAELQNAKEEARVARSELSERFDESVEVSISNSKAEMLEFEKMFEETQSLMTLSASISSVNEDLLKSHSFALSQISSFKTFACENSTLLNSVVNDYGTLISCLKKRISELQNNNLKLQTKFDDLQEQMQGASINAQNSVNTLAILKEQYDLEKSELLCRIGILEREVHSLSSSSLSREKESMRKELDKTKTKLKETESKLKNIIQEKTRLEGERANAEREIKKLHGQKALLERDLCKRDSLAGRRRDSVVDRPRAFDSKRAKGQENTTLQTLQEDYKKLEVPAFEMETAIGSLEEKLAAANQEKAEILARNESLSAELETLLCKLDMSSIELNALQEEISDLRLNLEKSETSYQKLESQINLLAVEKEELAMQLTNGLLELEEERALWSAKEKASVEAIKERANVYNSEITSLSSELSQVRNEILSVRKEYELLQERLRCAEEHAEMESICGIEKTSVIDKLKHALEVAECEKKDCEEMLKSKLDALSSEHSRASVELKRLHMELATLIKDREELLVTVQEQQKGSSLSNELQEKVKNNKDTTKLKMRLKWTQAKLDAFRERYKEAINEQELMQKKFEEGSTKLKERLASYGLEVLNLTKQLADAKSTL